MKKRALLIICLVLSTSFVCAENIKGSIKLQEPKWSDYCPLQFAYATIYTDEEINDYAIQTGKANKNIFYCKSDTKLANAVRIATVLPAIDCKTSELIKRKKAKKDLIKQNEEIKYWLERKKDFDNLINECNKSVKNKAECYAKADGKIGATIMRDNYNKNYIIIYISPGSPAYYANLPAGSKILSIDDIDVKNMSYDSVLKRISGIKGTSVKLDIQNLSNKKETYVINRGTVVIPQKPEKDYDVHWQQIVPEGYANAVSISGMYFNIRNQPWIQRNNYWADRKNQFTKGYNACKTYSTDKKNDCLMNLVNREIAKTESDRQIEIQREMMRQQAIQNSINNMNQMQINNNLQNINNNLQRINNRLMW